MMDNPITDIMQGAHQPDSLVKKEHALNQQRPNFTDVQVYNPNGTAVPSSARNSFDHTALCLEFDEDDWATLKFQTGTFLVIDTKDKTFKMTIVVVDEGQNEIYLPWTSAKVRERYDTDGIDIDAELDQ